MARASDFEAVGRGLESIERSRVRRMLQEYQAAQDAEAKRRYEEQQARQLGLDADMRKFRENQLTNQTNAATAAQTRWQAGADRQARLDAAKAQQQAEAQGRQTAFASEFGPAVAADPETNPTPFGEATGGLPATPENIRAVGMRTGTLTPEQLLRSAQESEQAAAKAAPAAEPKVFQTALEIPGFGKIPVTITPNGVTKFWVKDKEKPALSPNAFVALTKQMESYDAPIIEKEKEIMALSGSGQTAERGKLYAELGQLRLKRQAVEKFMTSYTGGTGSEFEFETAGPDAASQATSSQPAGKPAADFDYVPGKGLMKPGGTAPTPPDNREEDPELTAPPVAVQPAKPEVAPTPIPARPSPAAQTSAAIGELTDADFVRTVRSFPPDQQNSINEALLEVIARKMGIQPGAEALRIGGSRVFRNPSSHIETLAKTPEFTQFWNALPAAEKSALLKSALVGGRVTNPTTGTTLGRLPQFK